MAILPHAGSTAQVAPTPHLAGQVGTLQRRALTRKEKVWIFMEDNTLMNTFILLVILFSTVCFVLETELKQDEYQMMWFGCVPHLASRRRCIHSLDPKCRARAHASASLRGGGTHARAPRAQTHAHTHTHTPPTDPMVMLTDVLSISRTGSKRSR